MLLLLVGCLDPISNRLFFEDQEFLDALPSAEEDRVRYEATTSPDDEDGDTTTTEPGDVLEAPKGAPGLLVLTVESVNGVNAMVDSLLGIVDLVRSHPPTSREDNSRIWGPFPADDAPAHEVRMVSVREGFGEFTWGFEVAPSGTDEWRAIFSGLHSAGATVREGDGRFAFDGVAVDEINQANETPFYLEADYDHRDGSAVSFSVWRERPLEDELPLATYDYAIDPDAAGTLVFDAPEWEIGEGGKPEHWRVTSHWAPDLGGRGDASVTGGDLGGIVVEWTECWLPDGTLVYQADNWGFVPEPVGTEDDCTVAPGQPLARP
jgi:hypothetical protein